MAANSYRLRAAAQPGGRHHPALCQLLVHQWANGAGHDDDGNERQQLLERGKEIQAKLPETKVLLLAVFPRGPRPPAAAKPAARKAPAKKAAAKK